MAQVTHGDQVEKNDPKELLPIKEKLTLPDFFVYTNKCGEYIGLSPFPGCNRHHQVDITFLGSGIPTKKTFICHRNPWHFQKKKKRSLEDDSFPASYLLGAPGPFGMRCWGMRFWDKHSLDGFGVLKNVDVIDYISH